MTRADVEALTPFELMLMGEGKDGWVYRIVASYGMVHATRPTKTPFSKDALLELLLHLGKYRDMSEYYDKYILVTTPNGVELRLE